MIRDPSRWICRRYRAAFANCMAGTQAAGHPKGPRGSRIRRWKDKSSGGCTNRMFVRDSRSGSPRRNRLIVMVTVANCFLGRSPVSARNLLFWFYTNATRLPNLAAKKFNGHFYSELSVLRSSDDLRRMN